MFVNFPMGNALGAPFDRAQQRRILCDALDLAASATRGGVLVDLPYRWPTDFAPYLPIKDRAWQLRK